jgi:hypothetical protein
MKRRAPNFPYAVFLITLLCLPALLAARSHGPDEVKPPESLQSEPVAPVALDPAASPEPTTVRPLSPLMSAIQNLWEARQVEIIALKEQLRSASDHAAALAILHEIEALQASTEIEILRLQADHVRREGREAAAQAIEAAIAEQLNPSPVCRPAPRRESGTTQP